MSLVYYKQDETTPLLLKKEKRNVKRNVKLLKWSIVVILIGASILSAIYLLYFSIDTKIQPELNDATKKKNTLHISSVATTNDDYLKKCAPPIKCYLNSKYRSLNGSCNNLKAPTWGAAETPFLRMLDANYSDDYYKFRLQSNGSALPSARLLTVKIFLNREIYRVDENNVLLLLFAQFLANDVSSISIDVPKNEHGEIIDCCKIDNVRKTYPQCQNVVESPLEDPVYIKSNIFCIGTFRYQTSRNYSCPLYLSTYINVNTHFIDASEVYGSNDNNALRLRVTEGGRLKFSVSRNGQMFCPVTTEKSQEKTRIDDRSDDIQFDTGKQNGNQNLGTSMMKTLFLRFHNYIAFTLSSINPHWSDEILYQESRRIVIATIQRITYQDFLPIIIGDDFQEVYGLNKENIYDPNTNPSMSLELSDAALRVLRTIIPVQFNLMDNNYKIVNSMSINDWLTKPNLLSLDNNFDKLLRGLLETPGRIPQPSYNFYISNYIHNNHYFNKPRYIGRDLLSGDIVSGRDIGLQSYNQVRHLCGFHKATDFEDLTDFIHIKDLSRLKELYHSVNDIDLIVGLLLEKHIEGAMVGPTSRCLIADGFFRFKSGDRYFYDIQDQPGSFTPNQLKVIKKITLGHIICTTSNVDQVQNDIFKVIDRNLFPTFKLNCDDKFLVDLDEWIEPDHRPKL